MAYKYRHLFFLLLGLQVCRVTLLQASGQLKLASGFRLGSSLFWMPLGIFLDEQVPKSGSFQGRWQELKERSQTMEAHESLCLCLFTNTSMAKARPMAKLKVNGSGIYIFHILC